MKKIAKFRVLIFGFGLFLTGVNIFLLISGRQNEKDVAAATGAESITLTASILKKQGRINPSETVGDSIFTLFFTYDFKSKRPITPLDVRDSIFYVAREGDTATIRFHPNNPTFLVAPKLQVSAMSPFDETFFFKMIGLGVLLMALGVKLFMGDVQRVLEIIRMSARDKE
jgi:hypothetical protein